MAAKMIAGNHPAAIRSEVKAVSSARIALRGTACRTDRAGANSPPTACLSPTMQLKRLNNAHPHVVHHYGMLRGRSGSCYVFQELATADMHDVAGMHSRRCMGEGAYVREWMLQLAHGAFQGARRACGVLHRVVHPPAAEAVCAPSGWCRSHRDVQLPQHTASSALRTRPSHHTHPTSCCAGVSFCHSNLVAHRDIKPENVLLVPFAVEPGRPPPSKTYFKRLVTQVWQDPSPAVATAASARIRDGFVAKVCDFGSSLVAKSAGQVAKSACGSQFYCAPEVRRLIAFRLNPEEAEDVWPSSTYKWEAIHSAGYDAFAADVWSFGMMLFTLTTGLKPFRSPCVADPRFQAFIRDTQRYVMQDELCAPHSAVWTRNLEDYRPAWRWPKAMSPALADLLKRCLKFRPADRCTMAQVLEHPWFADPTWRPASISRSIGSAQWAAARGPSDVSSDVPSRVLSGAGSDRAGALTFLSRATSDAKSDLTPLNMASTLSAGGGEGGVCSPLPAPAASPTSPPVGPRPACPTMTDLSGGGVGGGSRSLPKV